MATWSPVSVSRFGGVGKRLTPAPRPGVSGWNTAGFQWPVPSSRCGSDHLGLADSLAGINPTRMNPARIHQDGRNFHRHQSSAALMVRSWSLSFIDSLIESVCIQEGFNSALAMLAARLMAPWSGQQRNHRAIVVNILQLINGRLLNEMNC